MEHTKGEWVADSQNVRKANFTDETRYNDLIAITYSEANAKLIAAAPELLEALMNCQLGIEKMTGWEEVNEQANQAIKKATQ